MRRHNIGAIAVTLLLKGLTPLHKKYFAFSNKSEVFDGGEIGRRKDDSLRVHYLEMMIFAREVQSLPLISSMYMPGVSWLRLRVNSGANVMLRFITILPSISYTLQTPSPSVNAPLMVMIPLLGLG